MVGPARPLAGGDAASLVDGSPRCVARVRSATRLQLVVGFWQRAAETSRPPVTSGPAHLAMDRAPFLLLGVLRICRRPTNDIVCQ